MLLVAGLPWVLAASAQEQAPAPPPTTIAPAPAGPEAVLTTDAGVFVIRLRPDLAPAHVKYFAATASKHGYDKTAFHRIIPGGIIQGGDPLSKDPAKKALWGTGGLGVLKAEFSAQPMNRGAVAAVLRPSSKDSAGTQFFACLTDQPSLTGKYTIFGEVTEGMDVVDAIGRTPVVGDKPTQRVEIKSVEIREARPATP
jgi:peptidyl-prolyl cis-trans isomerase B (cyclophilin B)